MEIGATFCLFGNTNPKYMRLNNTEATQKQHRNSSGDLWQKSSSALRLLKIKLKTQRGNNILSAKIPKVRNRWK